MVGERAGVVAAVYHAGDDRPDVAGAGDGELSAGLAESDAGWRRTVVVIDAGADVLAGPLAARRAATQATSSKVPVATLLDVLPPDSP